MDTIFPKDIVMYIYKIVHRDRVDEINKEYIKHVKYRGNYLVMFSVLQKALVCYNYKKDVRYNCHGGRDRMGNPFHLCAKYYFSSGMLHPNAYK